MNDLSWLAPTILALGTLVTAAFGAWRSKENGKAIAIVKADTADVKADTARVVEHTNGTLSAATAAKDAAENAGKVLAERVEGLARELIALKLSSSLAATAAEMAATDVREAQAVIPPSHDDT